MYWRPLRRLLYPLLILLYSPMGSAKAFQIQFIDDDDQPVEFAVVASPKIPVSTAHIPTEPAIIDQINMQFSPMVIAVEQGREVSFPNSDNIRHHVYSFSKAKRFETKLYSNKPDSPVLFDQAGLVVLGCNIHDSMIGYVFVSPWQEYAVSAKNGSANIKADNPPKELEYWHPWSLTPNQVHTYKVKQWPKDGPLIIRIMLNKPQSTPTLKTFKRGFGSP
ncbi:MAG: plastocyanin [Oceanicoccus sp.]|jgi:plastocyanin